MHINDLPPEVLCKIFMYLEPKDWMDNVSCICLTWKTALNLVWRKVHELSHWSRDGTLTLANGKKLSINSTGKKHSPIDSPISRKSDYFNFGYFIENCAETLQTLFVTIPWEHPSWNIDEKRALIGATCKNLRSLFLFGNVASVLEELSSGICQNWISLHRIHVSFDPVDSSGDVGMFVGEIVATCQNLRFIDFRFTRGSLPVSVFDGLVEMKQLTRFCCESVSHKAQPPEYVENILSTLTRCSSALTEVELTCRISGKLNSSLCNRLMKILGEEKRITVLKFGFKLELPIRKLSPPEMNFNDEPVFHSEAPWTSNAPWTTDIIAHLIGFSHLHQLTLQNFDFFEPLVSETLQKLAPQLTLLHLAKNCNVNASFFDGWKAELPKLKKLIISNEENHDMFHVCLAEFVAKCPQLTSLQIGHMFMRNKEFLQILHENLHNCGDKKSHVFNEPLTVHFVNYFYFLPDQEEELKSVNFCGVENECSKIVISRICSK